MFCQSILKYDSTSPRASREGSIQGFLAFLHDLSAMKNLLTGSDVKDHINWCRILSDRIDNGILSMNCLGYAQAEDMGKFLLERSNRIATNICIHT